MEMEQTITQAPPQTWRQGLKGQSGNPTGLTKTRLRTAELWDEYVAHHGRQPSASDAGRLRACGKIIAKLERCNGRAISDEDVSRLTRNLNWTLRSLGLNGPRAARPASVPLPRDYGERK